MHVPKGFFFFSAALRFSAQRYPGLICVLIPFKLPQSAFAFPSSPLAHPQLCGPSHRGAEAAAAHGAPELSEGLPGGAGGVEALGQQHNAVEEEEGGQAVDDVLEILDAAKKKRGMTDLRE